MAKIYSKNESSVQETAKKEKEIRAAFAVTLQTAKITAIVLAYDAEGVKPPWRIGAQRKNMACMHRVCCSAAGVPQAVLERVPTDEGGGGTIVPWNGTVFGDTALKR